MVDFGPNHRNLHRRTYLVHSSKPLVPNSVCPKGSTFTSGSSFKMATSSSSGSKSKSEPECDMAKGRSAGLARRQVVRSGSGGGGGGGGLHPAAERAPRCHGLHQACQARCHTCCRSPRIADCRRDQQRGMGSGTSGASNWLVQQSREQAGRNAPGKGPLERTALPLAHAAHEPLMPPLWH